MRNRSQGRPRRATTTGAQRVPRGHPLLTSIVDDMLQRARDARRTLEQQPDADVRYYRCYLKERLWRIDIDGILPDGSLCWEGTKYETRVRERMSSQAAREVREGARFKSRSPRALMNHLCCDHIVPRSCVADVLIYPAYGLDLDDVPAARNFVLDHAEVAIIHSNENSSLKAADLESKMSQPWWDAPLHEKARLRMCRYDQVSLSVQPWDGA